MPTIWHDNNRRGVYQSYPPGLRIHILPLPPIVSSWDLFLHPPLLVSRQLQPMKNYALPLLQKMSWSWTWDRCRDNLIHDYLANVLQPKEFASDGAIPGAVNIPLGQVAEVFSMSPDQWESTVGRAAPQSDSPIIFSCLAGIRSHKAQVNREVVNERVPSCCRWRYLSLAFLTPPTSLAGGLSGLRGVVDERFHKFVNLQKYIWRIWTFFLIHFNCICINKSEFHKGLFYGETIGYHPAFTQFCSARQKPLWKDPSLVKWLPWLISSIKHLSGEILNLT